MNVKVLGCHGGESKKHRSTSFLVNDRIAIDAGAIAGRLSLDEQSRIETVLVSHPHLDHVRDLLVHVRVPGHNASARQVHLRHHHALTGDEPSAELRCHLLARDIVPAVERGFRRGCGRGHRGSPLTLSTSGHADNARRERHPPVGCVRRGRRAQRWRVTPTCRQYSSTGHVEHFGRCPVQMCFPNGTSSRLISIQYLRGSFCSSARIVASGDVVAT